jgi:hypothetical protein
MTKRDRLLEAIGKLEGWKEHEGEIKDLVHPKSVTAKRDGNVYFVDGKGGLILLGKGGGMEVCQGHGSTIVGGKKAHLTLGIDLGPAPARAPRKRPAAPTGPREAGIDDPPPAPKVPGAPNVPIADRSSLAYMQGCIRGALSALRRVDYPKGGGTPPAAVGWALRARGALEQLAGHAGLTPDGWAARCEKCGKPVQGLMGQMASEICANCIEED